MPSVITDLVTKAGKDAATIATGLSQRPPKEAVHVSGLVTLAAQLRNAWVSGTALADCIEIAIHDLQGQLNPKGLEEAFNAVTLSLERLASGKGIAGDITEVYNFCRALFSHSIKTSRP